MTTPRTHFAFRIIARTAYGRRQLAASSDFTTALAAYRTACECWPKAAITLRQGARVIEDSRRTPYRSHANDGSSWPILKIGNFLNQLRLKRRPMSGGYRSCRAGPVSGHGRPPL